MQKSITHLLLQLFMENPIQKVLITSDGDGLFLATATWAAEVMGYSTAIYSQSSGQCE